MSSTTPVLEWSCDDVSLWMYEQGFAHYADIFKNQHHIDGAALLTLSEKDLKSPPLEMKILGDIKRLSLIIYKLQAENESHNLVTDAGRKVILGEMQIFIIWCYIGSISEIYFKD